MCVLSSRFGRRTILWYTGDLCLVPVNWSRITLVAAIVNRLPSAVAALRSGEMLCPNSFLKASSGTCISSLSPSWASPYLARTCTVGMERVW